MHNSVFELSRTPVPSSEQAKAGHLPDWFYEQICDYAENPSPEQRQENIGQFCGALGSLYALDGDRLTIRPQIRETYFCKSYDRFTVTAETLAQTDYKAFSEYRTSSVLLLALDRLNNCYEDKRGVYIYLTETGDLMPLDRWIRTADFSKPFYIGGTINYYC